jgi:hypothetical protein
VLSHVQKSAPIALLLSAQAEKLYPWSTARVDRIALLAGRSQAAKPVPQDIVDGVILDPIEPTDAVKLPPELVALKAREELRFTPILEALGMNPRAIGTAQFMVSNLLVEPLSRWTQHAAVIEHKFGALQKCNASSARLHTFKHSSERLEITGDEEQMKSSGANCCDYVLKTGKLLGSAQLWELYVTRLTTIGNSKARSE